jgi:hypothetical protein
MLSSVLPSTFWAEAKKPKLRLSPRDTFAYTWMVWVGLAKAQLNADSEAVAWLRRGLDANRNFPVAHFVLAAELHVAEYVGSDPFLLRVNRFDGTADNLPIDNATWHFDPDPTIDVAVLPIPGLLSDRDHYVRFIDDEKESWWAQKAWKYRVGIGDFCYTVGLFRVLSGGKKNLPVVHFGTIARPIFGPDEELIPIRDWRDQEGKKVVMARAYLVESQRLGTERRARFRAR